jgi:drug/metabolite transporter (DMT)-like permease
MTLAVALAREWDPSPAVLAAAALALGLFAQAFRRLRERGRIDHAPWSRAFLFTLGVALLVLALVSPLDAIGEQQLVSAHMLQHAVLLDVGPALLLVALRGPLLFFLLPPAILVPLGRLRALRRLLRALLRPLVSFTAWIAVVAAWHLPQAYDYALRHQWAHDLEHGSFVLVGLLAWAILREKPPGRSLVAIPVALLGVILISGAFEHGAYGRNPGLGVAYGILTAVAYSAFLLVLRGGNRDLRRPAGPLFDATLVSALATIPIGLVWGNLDWTPGWKAQGYLLLLALSSQALGWLLISITLPRLPAALTSVLLTFQPVLSVLFAWAILSESPSGLQLGGVAFVLSGLLIVSAVRRQEPLAPEPGYVPAVAEVPD